MDNTGIKYDAGKPEYGLIPAHALEEVVKVLTFGANKYDRENWRKLEHLQRRYFDAAQRHMWATKRNEIADPESGRHHIAHSIVCLLFYLESELNSDIVLTNNETK
tara:strand:+ start:132 stop:449 length:318 start_codon:yes stop_codon:yes gene_type:complete